MKWEQVQLSSDGDDRRVIKFADMELFIDVESDEPRYLAIHKPTGIESNYNAHYSSFRPEWTTSDCIYKVINETLVER